MTYTVRNKQGVEYESMVKMYVNHCITCGVPFAMPTELDNEFRKNHNTMYCPNGHRQSYNQNAKTREQIEAERKVNELKQKLSESQSSERFWMDSWQKKIDENKNLNKELKRVKKRVQNGVCPCCNRTFQDLARHMKTKHPEQPKTNQP